MKMLIAACLTTSIATGALAQAQSPQPSHNQCWDTSRNELRDKQITSNVAGAHKGRTAEDRPSGTPAPSVGLNPAAPRPPGIPNCGALE